MSFKSKNQFLVQAKENFSQLIQTIKKTEEGISYKENLSNFLLKHLHFVLNYTKHFKVNFEKPNQK